jgi:hypothetical protein
VGGVVGESIRRLQEEIRRAAHEGGRGKRAPVNGDGDPRAKEAERLGRSQRIEMSGPEHPTPSPDREKREVEVWTQGRHAVEEIGITREVDVPAAGKEEAERDGSRADRWPKARMGGISRGDAHGADVDAVAGEQLFDLTESTP